jgi:hypothetical protein
VADEAIVSDGQPDHISLVGDTQEDSSLVRATRRTSLVAATRNPDSVRQMVSLVELARQIESGELPPDCHQTSALLPMEAFAQPHDCLC